MCCYNHQQPYSQSKFSTCTPAAKCEHRQTRPIARRFFVTSANRHTCHNVVLRFRALRSVRAGYATWCPRQSLHLLETVKDDVASEGSARPHAWQCIVVADNFYMRYKAYMPHDSHHKSCSTYLRTSQGMLLRKGHRGRTPGNGSLWPITSFERVRAERSSRERPGY